MEDREVVDEENGDATQDYEMRTTARTIPGSLIRRKEVASCQRRQGPSQSYAKASFGWNASSDRGVQVRFGLTCPFLRPACESSLNHDATTCHRENGGPQRLTAMVPSTQTVAPDGRFPTNSHDEQRLQR